MPCVPRFETEFSVSANFVNREKPVPVPDNSNQQCCGFPVWNELICSHVREPSTVHWGECRHLQFSSETRGVSSLLLFTPQPQPNSHWVESEKDISHVAFGMWSMADWSTSGGHLKVKNLWLNALTPRAMQSQCAMERLATVLLSGISICILSVCSYYLSSSVL